MGLKFYQSQPSTTVQYRSSHILSTHISTHTSTHTPRECREVDRRSNENRFQQCIKYPALWLKSGGLDYWAFRFSLVLAACSVAASGSLAGGRRVPPHPPTNHIAQKGHCTGFFKLASRRKGTLRYMKPLEGVTKPQLTRPKGVFSANYGL
jgi:hypothetical protein